MNGFDIKLLSEKTGITEGKVKMLLQRHSELQEFPYSFRTGRNRVFLPSMLVWLRQHEGILPPEADTLLSGNKPLPYSNDKKLTGALAREYRLAAEHELITKEQFQQLIGLVPSQSNDKPALPQPEKKTVYLPSLPTEEEQADQIVGHRVRAKQARKTEDHKTQIRLFEDGA